MYIFSLHVVFLFPPNKIVFGECHGTVHKQWLIAIYGILYSVVLCALPLTRS